MSGMIPRTFIDDLVDRVDIVEVIDSRVKLKKSGKNYAACCPFHDEKTPSFTVSPDKQFYYCFGCGATGNAIGFVMDYERTTFVEAVESLAKLAGLNVPREITADPKRREREQAEEKQRNSLYQLMASTNDYYQQQLRTHQNKERAVSYLKRRGLSGQIARDFGIGYAPPGWENLTQAIATSNEKQDRLLEAGMLVFNEEKDRLYDRFRDRVIFPIRDSRGRVIGFGGRVLTDEKPKYLNSPETPIFQKGKELYGLYEARQAYKQLPRLLIVEGYMDVITLSQYGIHYGVATLGTACGLEHLQRALRFTNEIVFCFDGDPAGRKAARRAMENTLPAMEDGRQAKFLYLPEGEDPDTLIRQIGADKFTHLIETAIPLEHFLFDELAQGIHVETMEGRARLCKLAAPLLAQLPTGIYKELMFNQLAKRTHLGVDALKQLLQELPKTAPTKDTHPPLATSKTAEAAVPAAISTGTPLPNAAKRSNHQPGADELALALLLYQPNLALTDADINDLRLSNHSNIKLLVELIDFLKQRPSYSSGQILGHWQGTYGLEQSERLRHLLGKGAVFHQARTVTEGRANHFATEQEFSDALQHLQQQQAQRDCEAIIQQLNDKPHQQWSETEKQLYLKAIAARSLSPPEHNH
ncbi:MAG: DNA primase [Cellvibrionaceae bacterium]|nr:DNA primase [Cellvibrionaceae bacterium]